MPFNGAGTFNRIYSWVAQAGLGQNIRSDQMDQDTNDIATALSNVICKDGQTTITANIPFNSKKITGLGSGSASTDSVNLGQVQTGASKYAAAAGTNTITASFSPTVTALTDGMEFKIKVANTVTGAATFNPDTTGALAIQLPDGSTLAGGEMIAAGEYTLRYKAANTTYQLLNPTPADGSWLLRNATDVTKKIKFLLSGITTGTTRNITVPDSDFTMVGTTLTQILTGKTISAASNTLTGVAVTGSAQTFTGAQNGGTTALTSSSASIAMDMSLNNNFSHTFTENTTLANPTNTTAGQTGQIAFTQHASAAKTLAFGTNWIELTSGVAATVSTTVSAKNILTYYVWDSTHIYYTLGKAGVT